MKRGLLRLLAVLLLVGAIADAFAGRRTLRIDFGDWEETDCSGTGVVRNGLIVEWSGFEFSGFNDPAYLTDTYCQETISEFFSDFSFGPDEAGLAELVGDNENGVITGVRQTLLDRERFEAQNDGEGGFQWAFYFFPEDVVIVALYGLIEDGQPIPLTNNTSFIREGPEFLWLGGDDGFDGEYFCFRAGQYTGIWDGEPVGTDPKLACPLPDRVFSDRFD